MSYFFKNKFIFIMMFFLFIGCSNKFISGEYYVDNSNVTLQFTDSSLIVKEDGNAIYSASLNQINNEYFVYSIKELYTEDIFYEFKKLNLKTGNNITVYKPSYINNNGNGKESSIININANFFGELHNYNLYENQKKNRFVENSYLRELETNDFISNHPKSVKENFDIQLCGKFTLSIDKEIQNLFEKNNEKPAIFSLDLLNKLGLEFSFNEKNVDKESDYSKINEMKIEDKVIRALSIELPEDNFFDYYRPAKISLFFSKIKKHNPGYKYNIYDTETFIEIDNRPGKHIIYFLDDLIGYHSFYIKVEELYEGLEEKIIIGNIDFYIE